MANNPTLLTRPLAEDGQKSTIPDTTDATSGLFSQQYGWQSINALPLQAGGKAVKREDFNGAFNLLGGVAFFAQKGWTFKFDDGQDYYVGCVVIDPTDGLRYECIADVAAGGSAPSADAAHWQLFASGGSDIEDWYRAPDTAYSVGDVRLLTDLPVGWYLEATTGGTTSASDLVITSPAIGDTVTDGTVVWTIREVASTADIPAPVDISGKANVDLDNLSAAGEAKIANIPLTSEFTIIYPNGGAASNPATISNNARYVEANPFPGYYVFGFAEIKVDNNWVPIYKCDLFSASANSCGIAVSHYISGGNDNIVIQTGYNELMVTKADGNPTGNTTGIVYTAPCRVKIWKIGINN